MLVCLIFFFFFQAEDGIRDLTVTGVQTCALPILLSALPEGVDFEPYLRNLDASIGRNLLASLPKSAAKGEKGVVVVRVQIQNDGSLPDTAVRIVSALERTTWMLQPRA